MRVQRMWALLLLCAVAGPAAAQQKVFNWVRAGEEVLRLDADAAVQARVYQPSYRATHVRVELLADHPVTVFVADQAAWNQALHDPAVEVQYWCVRENLVESTYECDLPASSSARVLVVHDQRQVTRAALGKIGSVFKVGRAAERLAMPNDVRMSYFAWLCVENCYPPEFRWLRLFKEKYELTPILKLYAPITPERDGEQISVKLKSPVPMIVAVIPTEVANQLHEHPETLVTAVSHGSCKQRGVQSLTFQCAFNKADGPQSLVVVPEPGLSVPRKKKAEVEVKAVRCVVNCQNPR